MRLGDLDALFAEIENDYKNANGMRRRGLSEALDSIADAPTIDAVEVVRCRDCKHWKKGNFMGGDTPDSLEYGGGCPLAKFARYESDFCSKGERKDGDGNG